MIMNKNIILEINRNLELMGVKTNKFLIKESVVPVPAFKVITAPIVQNYLKSLRNVNALLDLVPSNNVAAATTKLQPLLNKKYDDILLNPILKTQFNEFIKEIPGEALAKKVAELDDSLTISVDNIKKKISKPIDNVNWGEAQLERYKSGIEVSIKNVFQQTISKNATPQEKDFYDALENDMIKDIQNKIDIKIQDLVLEAEKKKSLDVIIPEFKGKLVGPIEGFRSEMFELLNTYWLNWIRKKFIPADFERITKGIAKDLNLALQDTKVHPYYHLRKLIFRFLPERPPAQQFEEAFLKWVEQFIPAIESDMVKKRFKAFLESEDVKKDLGDLFSEEYSKTTEGLKLKILRENVAPWFKLITQSPLRPGKGYGARVAEWGERIFAVLNHQTPHLPKELKQLYGAKSFRSRVQAMFGNKIIRFFVVPFVLGFIETIYDVLRDTVKTFENFKSELLDEENNLKKVKVELEKLREVYNSSNQDETLIEDLNEFITNIDDELEKLKTERKELTESINSTLTEKFVKNYKHWFPIWFESDPYNIGDDNFLKIVNYEFIQTPLFFMYWDEFIVKTVDIVVDLTKSRDDKNKLLNQRFNSLQTLIRNNRDCLAGVNASITNQTELTEQIKKIRECVEKNNPGISQGEPAPSPTPSPTPQSYVPPVKKYLEDNKLNPEYLQKATPDQNGFKWFLKNDFNKQMLPNSYKQDNPPVGQALNDDGTEGKSYYYDAEKLWTEY